MVQNRIFWAVQAIGFATHGSASFTAAHGVQSVGITTTFNLEQVFELGQIAIYENIEDIPDVEVTVEKVLDGQPLLYHLATRGYAANTLAGRANQRAGVSLSIYGDTQNSASGTPIRQVFMSGMYVSSLTYTFPVDGNSTEALTLVGNNKVWKSSAFTFSPNFDNTDSPNPNVQRRQHVVFATSTTTTDANGQLAASDATILPREIPGISSSGTNNRDAEGNFAAHVQSITISVDLGRENLNELGRRGPYHRFITFPTEVSCEIEIIATNGDGITALEASNSNLSNQSIRVYSSDGTFLNLGTKNKLNSVTYGGGDAGGGNATVTFSYTTFNELVVTHPEDPVS